MFGTMGISELIIILVIVLIIFGAGKLPQIGEGVGKALKGFKKEVHDIPQPETAQGEAMEPAVGGAQQRISWISHGGLPINFRFHGPFPFSSLTGIYLKIVSFVIF